MKQKSLISVGRSLVVCVPLLLVTVATTSVAIGQDLAADSMIVSLRQAVAAYDSDNPAVAERLLGQVVGRNPAAYDPVLGSAAYWLGVLYWEQNRRPEALDAWQTGWDSVREGGRVDLLLGDRLVWGVFDENDEARFDSAAAAYLTLLEHVGAADGERVRDMASRILVPLRLILPDSLKSLTQTGDEAVSGESRITSATGAALANWWRGMDALPATVRNERLIEHLRRTVRARSHYGVGEDGGFDDRGSIYIRFGPARRKTEMRLNPFEIGGSRISTPEAVRTSIATGSMRFPRNEFWVYPRVDENAQFLFIERRGEYRLGTTVDLLPGHLSSPRHARTQLKVLETVLSELALFHPLTYGEWYEEVAGQLMELELTEISARLNRRSTSVPAWTTGGHPLRYWQSSLVHRQMNERIAVRARDRQVPAAFFDDFGEIEDIALSVRTARFLNPDGTTRLEVYWTAPVAEFAAAHARLNGGDGSEPADFLIEFTMVEYDDRNRRVDHQIARNRLDGIRSDDDGVLFPQVHTVGKVRDGRRLALEWDILPLSDADVEPAHSRVGIAVRTLDSLTALTADRRLLEMSDLKPVLVNNDTDEEGPVYPGGVLTPQVSLGLQFEIYHLQFGADDRTSYTITYELERAEAAGFRTRARQVADTQTITSSTDYAGTSTTEKETIVLDLSGWTSPGRIRILVRARDENSGQEVVRALDYVLALSD